MENKIFKSLNSLTEIPVSNYQGYVWISGENKPNIINGNFTYNLKDKDFIIEGYLYDKQKKISISIKNYEGKYYISMIDLSNIDFNSENISKHTYLSDSSIVNRKKDFKYLKFIQYWKEEIDELCEKLEVLKPAWIAFVGFSENKNFGGKDDEEKK